MNSDGGSGEGGGFTDCRQRMTEGNQLASPLFHFGLSANERLRVNTVATVRFCFACAFCPCGEHSHERLLNTYQ